MPPLARVCGVLDQQDEEFVVDCFKMLDLQALPEPKLERVDPVRDFLEDLYTLKLAYIWRFDELDRADVLEHLKKLLQTWATIRTWSGSFANSAEEKTFNTTVNRWLAQLITIIKMQTESRQKIAEFRDLMLKEELRTKRPSYSEDLVTRPWVQFLHRDAPGWPVNWGTSPDVIAKQRIPNGGVALVRGYEKEARTILDFLDIGAGRTDNPRFRSGLEEAQNNVVVSEDGKSKTLSLGTVSRSPFLQLYKNSQGYYEGDLYPMTKMLGNADGHITTWGWSVANVQVRQPGGSKDEEDGAEKVGEEGMVDAQIMEL